MSDYLILPPDRNVLVGRTVTGLAGTPDPTYPLSWLTDQRPAFPIRYPAGAWAVSVSVDTKDIQLVVLANHSLTGNVTVGGAAGTITAPTPNENDISFNPYMLLNTPTLGVTALTFSGSNSSTLCLGEAFAGVPIELPALQMNDANDELFDGFDLAVDGTFSNIPLPDQGEEWRVFGGTQIFTEAQRDSILAWRRAQRTLSRPSVMIMDRTKNDARIVLIGRPKFKQGGHKDLYEGTLTFLEHPRYRW